MKSMASAIVYGKGIVTPEDVLSRAKELAPKAHISEEKIQYIWEKIMEALK